MSGTVKCTPNRIVPCVCEQQYPSGETLMGHQQSAYLFTTISRVGVPAYKRLLYTNDKLKAWVSYGPGHRHSSSSTLLFIRALNTKESYA